MSAFPLMLDGAQLRALVVGGGRVAERKALALVEAGATVRVVAPAVTEALAAAVESGRLTIARRGWEPGDTGDAMLVVVATDAREVNAAAAGEARALGRLVNVADAPDEGNCVTAAVHRAGDITVAVGAGGVPTVAARVRDMVAARLDDRYAEAVQALQALRRRTLDAGGAEAWREALAALAGDDFCDAVESGVFARRMARWG